MSTEEDSFSFARKFGNIYLSILALFCFKLCVKLSLALLSHFYIVRGNRKEAARIASEFYGFAEQSGTAAARGAHLVARLFIAQEVAPAPRPTGQLWPLAAEERRGGD